ncbi:hypothetical protein T08_11916 [Trichinella sp. T8]|nr:hypothetical protein T08_11916 [Trichinella sp. T8]
MFWKVFENGIIYGRSVVKLSLISALDLIVISEGKFLTVEKVLSMFSIAINVHDMVKWMDLPNY